MARVQVAVETPQRPDHLAINKAQKDAYLAGNRKELPEGIAFSDKSYDFRAENAGAVLETVSEHIQQAVDGYGGNLEIRSERFDAKDAPSMYGKSIHVTEIVMVYDKGLVGPHEKLIRDLVKKLAPHAAPLHITVIFR